PGCSFLPLTSGVAGGVGSGGTNAGVGTSSFVAGGDGGGYIQIEDNSTLFRIDRHCLVMGVFNHHAYSESSNENDAMACDTQTFFPQPAIWIRDSGPGTVTAYGVPF